MLGDCASHNFLVGTVVWVFCGMLGTLLRHLNYIVLIVLWSSAVKIQDLQAYTKMSYIKAYRSFTLVWRDMFWSLQVGFCFRNAPEFCAALARISAFDPCSFNGTKVFELLKCISFFWATVILVVMGLALFVISLVLSSLISMPYLEAVWSWLVTRWASSSSLPAKPSISSISKLEVGPPMLIVPECSLSASIIMCSKKLNSVGDKSMVAHVCHPTNFLFLAFKLWEPAYDIFVLRFQPKTSSFRLPYQCHCSSANCARELFKDSNRSASILVCTQKKNFWLGIADCLWVMS